MQETFRDGDVGPAGPGGPEVQLLALQAKIWAAFHVFDHDENDTVDIREIGTIMRSLNCCPREGDLQDMLFEIEDEESTGYVRYDRFLPVMTRILQEDKFKPAPEEVLLKAFQVLDMDNKGYLSSEEFMQFIRVEGEPFSQEEMEETLSAMADAETGNIDYKRFASMIAVESAY
ncbi:PREDICTED: EF-hand calcium-binding domain-containing protein 2-like isoform X2 [Priapulus caudatus]|uniref:EF-hand calcium-binding domain-containing protein 2-like isoform X1 n=1 Tax=Priapulus caudatus TaxID=37621 RepID=A0ABM1FBL1_PRICU|nr:PREDICTED: EF-hand calcium-binding domain-containing protein 2-like isoform X1 [Priapulus caudatus]XP_014681832.1 PREDICTED: EF-hand calcium-binding domain-containing protein 2-like isoform X2 [Priapulus caudatus]